MRAFYLFQKVTIQTPARELARMCELGKIPGTGKLPEGNSGWLYVARQIQPPTPAWELP
ncbi:hypothetical protein AB0G79_15310 [Streptomyces sp. NPDC020807]|uniref:hypothetical protein n=1 Tax=Streptomyces sp. NPDC020807 TaxID=3155119 RepID=UPI0033D00918